MGTLIAQPKTQKQLSAVKAVWKALDISFRQQKESPCDEAFAAKIQCGEKAAAEVKGLKVC